MSKIKRRVSVVLAAAMLFSAQPAFGFDVSYDGGDTDFVVTGNVDTKKAGQIITLKITDEKDNLIYTRQAETNAKGEYEFVFALDYEGDIVATVSENGVLLPSKTLYRSTTGEVTSAIERLAGDEKISTVIEGEADVLQVDLDEYKELSKSGLLNSFLEAQTYTSVRDFQTAYSLGKFLVAVENASSASQIVAAENTYPEAVEAAQSEVYKIYEAYDESEKLTVLNSLCGKAFLSIAAYAEARDEQIVIHEINSASNYNEKYKIVEDNNDILKLDLTKYNALGSKLESFKQSLFAESVASAAKLREYAEAAYTSVTEETDSSGSRGGSSNFKVSESLTSQSEVPSIQQFYDLEKYEWAKTAITVLAAKGIVNGKSEGVFAPSDNVTRAEFIKMLSGAFALSGIEEIAFADVPEGHWAHAYIEAAVANDIATGISESEFGTNNKITRQDMAVFCSRIMELKNMKKDGEEISFTDEEQIAQYAKEGVKNLAGAGIITGVGDGRFAPNEHATRAEAAVIIYRLSEYSGWR